MPRPQPALTLAFALVLAVPAHAQAPKELVGKYVMEVPDGDVLELRADGSAAMAGEETTWSAKGNQLRVGPDTMAYQLTGGRLLLSMGAVQLAWKRVGAAGKGPSPMGKAAARARAAQPSVSEEEADREAMEEAKVWLAAQGQQAPGSTAPRGGQRPPPAPARTTGGSPQDAQLRALLMGSAWCSFTYNQHTGTSTTRKVVFRPDGVMLTNGGTETYNSGPNGTVSGQYGSGGASRWQVQNLRLLVDQGDGAGFQDIGLTGTKNSSGAPILQAGGREYSMCN
jgi:hypothetical protein